MTGKKYNAYLKNTKKIQITNPCFTRIYKLYLKNGKQKKPGGQL